MKRIVPLSGILAVGLILASIGVAGEMPDSDSPASEVTTFYLENDSEQMASAFLGAYGAIFFLFFAASLRKALRRAEGEVGGASALGFAGAILFVAGLTAGSALTLTLADAADVLDPTAVQALNAVAYNFFFPFAAGAAAFLIGNGIAVLKTTAGGRLPRWMGWPAIVFGILAFSPAWFVGLPGLGLWTIATSILLAASAESSTPAAPSPSV